MKLQEEPYQLVSNPYKAQDYPKNRKGLLLQGAWNPDYQRLIEENEIEAIFLNSSKGWTDSDCSFLSLLPMLKEVNIIAAKVSGLEVLAEMPNLTDLAITASVDSQVSFERSTSLRNCYIYWWPGAASIFQCRSLQSVHLDSLRTFPEDWSSRWPELKSLTLANSKKIKNIEGISALRNLTKLELLNLGELADFSSIYCLQDLTWLAIRGCRLLRSIEFVSNLEKLEVLLLSENREIDTLAPLLSLHNLKAFSFVGTTVIKDGDLTGLTTLPNLSMLGFAPRKHYSHNLIKPWNWNNFGNPDKLLESK
jgi:hypothetical protein